MSETFLDASLHLYKGLCLSVWLWVEVPSLANSLLPLYKNATFVDAHSFSMKGVAHPSVRLFTRLFVVHLFIVVHLSIRPFVHSSVHSSILLSIRPFHLIQDNFVLQYPWNLCKIATITLFFLEIQVFFMKKVFFLYEITRNDSFHWHKLEKSQKKVR